MCLYDELDVILEVAMVVVVVVDNTEAVREDPHLHGSVGAAREDVIGRSHLDLHDAGAEVPEQRLASVLVGKGVERTLCGQAPDLERPGKKRRAHLKKKKKNQHKSSNLIPLTSIVGYNLFKCLAII